MECFGPSPVAPHESGPPIWDERPDGGLERRTMQSFEGTPGPRPMARRAENIGAIGRTRDTPSSPLWHAR